MQNMTFAPITIQAVSVPDFLYPLHVGGTVEFESGTTGIVGGIEILPDQSIRFTLDDYDGDPRENYSTDEIVAVFA